MQVASNSASVQETQSTQLTREKRVCRILYFFFLVGLVYVDILFLFEISTNNDYKRYFISTIIFLIIPQAILFILNIYEFMQSLSTNTFSKALSLLSLSQIKQGCYSQIAIFASAIHYFSILIGLEHFFLSIFTAFARHSTIYLEKKYFRSILIHGIDGSVCILIIQCHFLFGSLDNTSFSYRYYLPIVLRAFQFPIIFLGYYQSEKNISFLSYLKSQQMRDFLVFTFEGIGRALMIGSTAEILIFDPSFSDTPFLLTQEIVIIELLVCLILGFSIIFYITFNHDLYCGIIYTSVLIHQCLIFRIPNTFMKQFNSFYTTISKQNAPGNWQLRFLQLIPTVWRIVEILAIFLVMYLLQGEVLNRFNNHPNGKLIFYQMFLISMVINCIQIVLLSCDLITQCVEMCNTFEISPQKEETNGSQQIDIQSIQKQIEEQQKSLSPHKLILNNQLINNPDQKQQLVLFPGTLQQNQLFQNEIHNNSDEITTRSNNTN